MTNQTGKIQNFIDKDTIEYFLNYWQSLPKEDNGLRYSASTNCEQEWNVKLKEKLQKLIDPYFRVKVTHSLLFSDYHPGGIHSDGYIDYPESSELAYTFLIPLSCNYEQSSTIVFNETSEKSVTFNNATGLGNKGVKSYQQESLPTGKKLGKGFLHQFLPHLTVDSLPFSLNTILFWEIGSAIYWPRKNYHTSAWFPQKNIDRKALVILTNV